MSNTKNIVKAVQEAAKLTKKPIEIIERDDAELSVRRMILKTANRFSHLEITDILDHVAHLITEKALEKSGPKQTWSAEIFEGNVEVSFALSKTAKTEKVSASSFPKARLTFDPDHFYQRLVEDQDDEDEDAKTKLGVTKEAAVYLTAVIEYLVAEVVELAGIAAFDAKRKRITPGDVQKSVAADEQLNELLTSLGTFSKITLPGKVLGKKDADAESQDGDSVDEKVAVPNGKPEVSKKQKIVYALFDYESLANEDLERSELINDSFRGLYATEMDAMIAFARFAVDVEQADEEDYFENGVMVVPKADLEKIGMKIVPTPLP